MTQKHAFQAEVQELLELMIHSIYSNKDIFLRELISNASDALDRRRFEAIQRPELASSAPGKILLQPKPEARSLTLWDNGIGMSEAELIENLGTIAKSGTGNFIKQLKEAQKTEAPDLIGQFGVGFYSAFMVADEITVLSRRAGEEKATLWRSHGGAGYEIEPAERDEAGTTITLKLKTPDEDDSLKDYTDSWVLKDIVKRYSDFVAYPIELESFKKGEGEAATLELQTERLNSMKAIWARPKEEVTEAEYHEFYKHISHDWQAPLEHIVVHLEGSFQAQALLYLPKHAPFDLFHPEMKRGIQLYVKRVFIMDESKELIPAYLRWVKGVVDAEDLSLNVSREVLQQSRQIRAIKKQLVKRVFNALDAILADRREDYEAFFKQFGAALKEGLVNAEPKDKDRILSLILQESSSSEGKLRSLKEVVEAMPEGQEHIYYLSGQSLSAVKNSPHLEAFKKKGIEVLFFVDPIDEIWLSHDLSFEGKHFKSVGQGDVDLNTEKSDEEKEASEAQNKAFSDLLLAIRSALQDEVKEVRLSERLTESAVCLVSDEGDMNPQMAQIMRQLGQEAPQTKRIMELNPDHAVLAKMRDIFEADPKDARIQSYAELLFGQAVLAEGGQIEKPAAFSKLIAELMAR